MKIHLIWIWISYIEGKLTERNVSKQALLVAVGTANLDVICNALTEVSVC